MSPEMATGPLTAIDARSDVYLLRDPVRNRRRASAAHRPQRHGLPLRGGPQRDRADRSRRRADQDRPPLDGVVAKIVTPRRRISKRRFANINRTPKVSCSPSSAIKTSLAPATRPTTKTSPCAVRLPTSSRPLERQRTSDRLGLRDQKSPTPKPRSKRPTSISPSRCSTSATRAMMQLRAKAQAGRVETRTYANSASPPPMHGRRARGLGRRRRHRSLLQISSALKKRREPVARPRCSRQDEAVKNADEAREATEICRRRPRARR